MARFHIFPFFSLFFPYFFPIFPRFLRVLIPLVEAIRSPDRISPNTRILIRLVISFVIKIGLALASDRDSTWSVVVSLLAVFTRFATKSMITRFFIPGINANSFRIVRFSLVTIQQSRRYINLSFLGHYRKPRKPYSITRNNRYPNMQIRR